MGSPYHFSLMVGGLYRSETKFKKCVYTIPLCCNHFQQPRRVFMFLSLRKMWGNVEPTSLTLLDEANICFSLLKLLTANPVGVVLYPVRFQNNDLFWPYLPNSGMDWPETF